MTHTKKELVSANSQAPIAIQSDIHCTRSRPFVSTEIIERTVTTETVVIERTYLTIAPMCGACGEAKEHVVGAWFECVNEDCPTHDPDTGSAIPLPGEGEDVIDVEPIRRAA